MQALVVALWVSPSAEGTALKSMFSIGRSLSQWLKQSSSGPQQSGRPNGLTGQNIPYRHT